MPLNVLVVEPYPFGQVCGNLRTQSYIMSLTDRERFRLVLAVPFASDFTRWAQAQGVECLVVPPHPRLLQYGGRWAQDGWRGKILTMAAFIDYNFRLLPWLWKKKVDVIYCNCIRSILYVGLAAKLMGTPLLWYSKGELVNGVLDRVGFLLADKILFFCESNKHDKYPILVKRFDRKIGILKIGLDPAEILKTQESDKESLQRELALDPKRVNLVTVGRLYREKGVHILLEALGQLVGEFPDFCLYIVGDPVIEAYQDYPEELWRIVRKYGLDGHVRFTGWRKDALEIISLMDILVHPSLSEGFGRAVLEGMALGKPVLASRVGGLREAIQDGENGFLVAPGDVQGLKEKLRLMLKDPDLRHTLGARAREKVWAEHLISDKMAQLEDCWLELARRRP